MEALAQHYASLLKQRRASQSGRPAATEAPQPILRTVDLRSVRTKGVRSVGVKHIGVEHARRLRLEQAFVEEGLSELIGSWAKGVSLSSLYRVTDALNQNRDGIEVSLRAAHAWGHRPLAPTESSLTLHDVRLAPRFPPQPASRHSRPRGGACVPGWAPLAIEPGGKLWYLLSFGPRRVACRVA